MITTDTFLKDMKTSWDEVLPEIKADALLKLNNNYTVIDLVKMSRIKISENLSISDTTLSGGKDYGIYVFQIRPSKDIELKDFESQWKSNKSIVYTPKISKGRFKTGKAGEWSTLYVGKSETLESRIHEHCFQDIDKTTYGLKLKHRKQILASASFRYSFYRITQKDFDKHLIQFVMVNLERAIRDELKPWIGKQ